MESRENFRHPYWEKLNEEEKKAWLQAQIEACLAEAGEEDDFLAACLEELDRMTPELSPSPQSIEKQLQKILSTPKTTSRTAANTAIIIIFFIFLFTFLFLCDSYHSSNRNYRRFPSKSQ